MTAIPTNYNYYYSLTPYPHYKNGGVPVRSPISASIDFTNADVMEETFDVNNNSRGHHERRHHHHHKDDEKTPSSRAQGPSRRAVPGSIERKTHAGEIDPHLGGNKTYLRYRTKKTGLVAKIEGSLSWFIGDLLLGYPPIQTILSAIYVVFCGLILWGFDYDLWTKVVTTVFISVFMAIELGVGLYIIMKFYNNDKNDDSKVTVQGAFDFYIAFVISAGMELFQLWLWGGDSYWSGIERHQMNPFRIELAFVFTSAMLYGGGGMVNYFPEIWVSEIVLALVITCNTIVTVLILGVAISLALERIDKMSEEKKKNDSVKKRLKEKHKKNLVHHQKHHALKSPSKSDDSEDEEPISSTAIRPM